MVRSRGFGLMTGGAGYNVLNKSLFHQAAAAAHATALRLASALLSLAFGMVAARLLGVETFGGYVSLMAIAGLVTVASSVGMPTLIVREVAAARGSIGTARLRPLIDGCVFILLLLGVAAVLSGFWSGLDIGLVLAFVCLSNGASFLGALHAGFERVLFASWIDGVVRPVCALVALVALVWSGLVSAQAAVAGQIIGVVLAACAFLYFIDLHRASQTVRSIHSQRRRLTDHWGMAKTGALIAGTQLLINATTQIDILILTAMTGPADVAHYYAAARAAIVVSFFFGSCGALAEPRLTRLYASGDMESFKRLINSTALLGVWMTVLAALGALIVAPYYFEMYGPTFSDASTALLILVFGLVAWSLFGPALIALRAVRQDKKLLAATVLAVASNIGLSLLLVPAFGMNGAAVGTAAQFIVFGCALALFLTRTTSLRTDVFQFSIWKRALSWAVPRKAKQNVSRETQRDSLTTTDDVCARYWRSSA